MKKKCRSAKPGIKGVKGVFDIPVMMDNGLPPCQTGKARRVARVIKSRPHRSVTNIWAWPKIWHPNHGTVYIVLECTRNRLITSFAVRMVFEA